MVSSDFANFWQKRQVTLTCRDVVHLLHNIFYDKSLSRLTHPGKYHPPPKKTAVFQNKLA